MSAALVGSPLDRTVTARWRRRLVGAKPEERRHWRTKTAYYQAANQLLATGSTSLGWAQIARAVQPKGSRSTFYEVTGASAKHALIKDLMADDGIDAMQLVLCYRRRSPVDQLIDETKVWTYWPYRECLAIRYGIEPFDAEASTGLLVSTVKDWAGRNAPLAAALDHAPPVCAVEDLLALRPGQFSAMHAVGTLTQAVRDAVG